MVKRIIGQDADVAQMTNDSLPHLEYNMGKKISDNQDVDGLEMTGNNTQPSMSSSRPSAATSYASEKRKPAPVMPPTEERDDIFQIISSMEKELDNAFSMKDAQKEAREAEIKTLKQQLAQANGAAAALAAQVSELNAELTSQEELNAALKFLEEERAEAITRINLLQEDGAKKSLEIETLGKRILFLSDEAQAREVRIEQIELELSTSCELSRNLKSRVSMLEQERETLITELARTKGALGNVTAERDRSNKELEFAKASIDEIRATISKTRAKARGHLYES